MPHDPYPLLLHTWSESLSSGLGDNIHMRRGPGLRFSCAMKLRSRCLL